MTPIIRIVVSAVTLGLLIKLLKRRRDFQLTDVIHVTIGKDGNIEASPDPARVKRGRPIRWEHNFNRLTIVPRPRAFRPWPFSNRQPEAVNGQPVHSGAMRRNALVNVPHKYDIIAHTGSGVLELDPDIIIHV